MKLSNLLWMLLSCKCKCYLYFQLFFRGGGRFIPHGTPTSGMCSMGVWKQAAQSANIKFKIPRIEFPNPTNGLVAQYKETTAHAEFRNPEQ